MRIWRRVTIAGLICLPIYTAIMFAVGTVAFLVIFDPVGGWAEARRMLSRPIEMVRNEEWWWFIGYPVLLLVASQAMFLVPYVYRKPAAGGSGWPMKVSLAAVAIVAAVLTVGLLLAILGLIDLVRGEVHPEYRITAWIMLGLVVLPSSWVIWTMVLLVFAGTGRRGTPTRRVLGLLVGGTVLEFLLVLPLDAMVRRRTDCYCDTHAFYAMCLSAWSLLWLAGPGIVLLLTRRARHRLWSRTNCPHCGYAKGPSPGKRCPECGSAWS